MIPVPFVGMFVAIYHPAAGVGKRVKNPQNLMEMTVMMTNARTWLLIGISPIRVMALGLIVVALVLAVVW